MGEAAVMLPAESPALQRVEAVASQKLHDAPKPIALLMITLFGVINIVLFRLIAASGLLASTEVSFPILALAGSVVAALVGFLILSLMAEATWGEVKRQSFGIFSGASVVITLATSGALVWLFSYEPFGSITPGEEAIFLTAIVACLVAFAIFVRRQFSGELESSLGGQTPHDVELLDGSRLSTSVLRVGDQFRVRAPWRFPCDAVLAKGVLEIRSFALGSLGQQILVQPGQTISAMSELLRGEGVVEVEDKLEDSRSYEFARGVHKSLSAEEVQLINPTWSFLATLGVWFMAACTVIFWSRDGGASLGSALLTGAAVALAVVPISLTSLYSRIFSWVILRLFSRDGIFLRNANVITRLSRVSAIGLYRPASQYSDLNFELGSRAVFDFALLDDRVERDALFLVVRTACSLSETPIYRAIASHLAQVLPEDAVLRARPVTDFRDYGAKGLSASIEGVEISVGPESYLIDRGVMLQASDVEPALPDCEVIYVAMGDQVLIRAQIGEPLTGDGRALNEELTKNGIVTYLYSESGAANVLSAEVIGRRAGIPAHYCQGAVTRDDLSHRVSAISPCLVFSADSRTVRGIQSGSTGDDVLVASYFNPVLFDTKDADLTLFSQNLKSLSRAIQSARSLVLLRKAMLIALLSALFLTVALGASRLLPVFAVGFLLSVLILGAIAISIPLFCFIGRQRA